MINKENDTQKNVRKEKRAQRKALDSIEKNHKSIQITQKILADKNYQKAKAIGAYLCMPEEVNVNAIIESAWADGKKVYLPVVIALGKPLKFALYTPQTTLTKDCLDIEIPKVNNSEYASADALDLVVTPLVAFDEFCNRIGMGGGFYDRTFAFKAGNEFKHEATEKKIPTLIGAAFETQRVAVKITTNHWDIAPDMIITETNSYYS